MKSPLWSENGLNGTVVLGQVGASLCRGQAHLRLSPTTRAKKLQPHPLSLPLFCPGATRDTMGAKRGRARELADLVEKPVKDYDPEADVLPSDDDDRSADEASDNEPAGTEHYVAVGKSKLRRHEPLNLGPHYRGTRVSREALEAEDDEEDDEEVEGEDLDEDEEEEGEDGSSDYEDAREQFDDPDAADLEADQQGHEDDEIDSDDAVVYSQEEWPRQTADSRRFMGSDSEQDDQEEAGEEEDEDDDEESEEEEESDDLRMNGLIDDEAEESEDDDLDLSDAQDGLSDEDSADSSEDDESEDSHSELEEGEEEETGKKSKSKSKRSSDSGIAASVREMMGEQSVVKSLLKNVDADVQKGKAVHRQRKGFDALLNVRIRLQKSIVAVNSFGYADKPEDQTVEPYEAAERSALQLWNALDDFRATIHKGKKRKHADTDDTSTSALLIP
ncbi:hypothetical protein NPX13_g10496 [Xylaria arbuscula]|uniref:AATF leucine zipper-containing domain-containing protein n=1 Tax=Xylaria arbuscula TaxID=114810 RepID=A0A9W8N4N7_9PEZI|nr:hypothetical protein NPX13_g10496 [Xylaria arbuscula]